LKVSFVIEHFFFAGLCESLAVFAVNKADRKVRKVGRKGAPRECILKVTQFSVNKIRSAKAAVYSPVFCATNALQVESRSRASDATLG
jgi:hypothetical protein